MADAERIKRAFLAAHEAGDTEAATQLAKALRSELNQGAAVKSVEKLTDVQRGSGLATVFASGATLGFADEILAAPLAALAYVSEGIPFGDAYTGIRGEIRKQAEKYREERAGVALGAELVGGLMTAGAGAARAGASSVVRSAPPVARMIGTGAAAGGVAGAGYSDSDSTGETLADAAVGAAMGGAIGGALPPTARAVGRTFAAAGRAAANAVQGAPTRAARQISQALSDSRLTPAQAALSARNGKSLLDVVPALQDMAEGIAQRPGPGRRRLLAEFRNRHEQLKPRILEAAREAISPDLDDFAGAMRALKQQQRTAGGAMYNRARRVPVEFTPSLQQLAQRPMMQRAMKAGIRAAKDDVTLPRYLAEGLSVDNPNMVVWDYAYKGLGDLIRRNRGSDLARRAKALQSALMKEVSEQNPTYAQAVRSWADEATIQDAMRLGRSFLRESRRNADEAMEALDGIASNDSAMQAFRLGVGAEIRDIVRKAPRRLDGTPGAKTITSIIDSDVKREALARASVSPKAYQKLMRGLEAESAFMDLANRLERGSQTAFRQNAQKVYGDVDAAKELISSVSEGGAGFNPLSVVTGGFRAVKQLMRSAAFEQRMDDELLNRILAHKPEDVLKALRESQTIVNLLPKRHQRAVRSVTNSQFAKWVSDPANQDDLIAAIVASGAVASR